MNANQLEEFKVRCERAGWAAVNLSRDSKDYRNQLLLAYDKS